MGMTNKEKFKEVFGLEIGDTSDCGFFDCTDMKSCRGCPVRDTKDWWYSEYKEPTTKNDCTEQNGCITCSLDDGDDCCRKLYEESMQEPTTKNDLGVDCISRADAIRVASGYCHPLNVAKELAKLPSMGRYDPYTDKFIKE